MTATDNSNPYDTEENWDTVRILAPGVNRVYTSVLQQISYFRDRLGTEDIFYAAHKARSKRPDDPNAAWQYFCGICQNFLHGIRFQPNMIPTNPTST